MSVYRINTSRWVLPRPRRLRASSASLTARWYVSTMCSSAISSIELCTRCCIEHSSIHSPTSRSTRSKTKGCQPRSGNLFCIFLSLYLRELIIHSDRAFAAMPDSTRPSSLSKKSARRLLYVSVSNSLISLSSSSWLRASGNGSFVKS